MCANHLLCSLCILVTTTKDDKNVQRHQELSLGECYKPICCMLRDEGLRVNRMWINKFQQKYKYRLYTMRMRGYRIYTTEGEQKYKYRLYTMRMRGYRIYTTEGEQKYKYRLYTMRIRGYRIYTTEGEARGRVYSMTRIRIV